MGATYGHLGRNKVGIRVLGSSISLYKMSSRVLRNSTETFVLFFERIWVIGNLNFSFLHAIT